MWVKEYQDCLEYIDKYWEKVIYEPSPMHVKFRTSHFLYQMNHRMTKAEVHKSFIKLPHYYFVPNDGKFTYIFYWDSFFMFLGLLGTKRQWLMKEMIKNFVYLFENFGIIPNFSAPSSIGRSQPPFFSSMILDAYYSFLNPANPYAVKGKLNQFFYRWTQQGWFKQAIKTATEEYDRVWIDKDMQYNHHVPGYNLSRYGDRDIGYAYSSELESGWDMTSRFYSRCDQYLPIDLNSYLYKYEKDFAHIAKSDKNHEERKYWLDKAQMRQKEMHELMWNPSEGFFFDYNHVSKHQGSYFSLAAYTTMWSGLATVHQAKQLVQHLSKFETPYGLTIGTKDSLAKPIHLDHIQNHFRPAIRTIIQPKQWDYPNIWAPLEYLTVAGLLKYGYINEAKRIMESSIKAHAALFRKHKTFFEKINGETGEISDNYDYAEQEGFGWTNAVFYRYIMILDALETKKTIYREAIDKTSPPYGLNILH